MRTPTLALLLVAAPAWATSTASLSPDTAPPGSPVTLSITTDTDARPDLGALPGVDVLGTGQSSQVRIVNGVVDRQTTYTYRVVPRSAGTLKLGPFTVGPDRTASVTLTVDPAAAAPPPARMPFPSMRPGRSAPKPSAPDVHVGERAFARIWVDDPTPVVGQAVPLTINAYLRQGTGGTLEAAPQLTTTDFVVAGLDDEPARSETTVDGVPHTRFTWTASLTPVRAGSFDLSTEIPATLQWVERVPSQRRSLLDDLLADDPFLRGSGLSSMLRGFGGMGGLEPQVRSARVELEADRSLTVDALPTDGRPAGFTGAVGDFALGEVAADGPVAVGEPVEVVWTLTAKGNLDALDHPGIAAGPTWDVYGVEREVTADNRSRTEGTVTFRQLVMPRAPGPLDLGALTLTWYDPADGAFHEDRVAVPVVEVTGAAIAPSADAVPDGVPADAAPADVRADRLLPWLAREGILAVPVVLWVLILGAWLGGERLRTTAGRLQARWIQARLRSRVGRLARSDDAEAFFRAGLDLLDRFPAAARATTAQRFREAADRTLYGRQVPDPDARRALAAMLLADDPTLAPRSPLHEEAA